MIEIYKKLRAINQSNSLDLFNILNRRSKTSGDLLHQQTN